MASSCLEAVRGDFFFQGAFLLGGGALLCTVTNSKGEVEKIGWLFRTVEFWSGLVQIHEMYDDFGSMYDDSGSVHEYFVPVFVIFPSGLNGETHTTSAPVATSSPKKT